MIKAIIIDDEIGARNYLKHAIKETGIEIELLGEAENALTGLNMINELQPNVVFLDVEMPGGSGLDMLSAIKNITFKVIFTTAFSEYAIKAIKYSALDYLVKPIIAEELKVALQRADKALAFPINTQQLTNLQHNLHSDLPFDKLSLNSMDEISVVNVNDILYCKAVNNYTEFYLIENNPKLITKTLLHFENLLEDHNFFRCHRGYLVNMNHVKSFSREDGGMAVLNNKTKVPVASRRKLEFIDRIK